jgi:hypothetical protein
MRLRDDNDDNYDNHFDNIPSVGLKDACDHDDIHDDFYLNSVSPI